MSAEELDSIMRIFCVYFVGGMLAAGTVALVITTYNVFVRK